MTSPPFPPGKLPGHFLSEMLGKYVSGHPSLLVGPEVGADAAAIEVGDRVLVLKTDPITFPTPDAAGYLVNVNANDIACMGAEPRWILVTALLPEDSTTPVLVEDMFANLKAASEKLGIVLAGGHSEITIGLDRPILTGMMIGETTRDALLDLRRTRPGDAVILCNGIAIEGTAILASEAPARMLASVPPSVVERARDFVTDPGISVVNAARTLRASSVDVRGMHDPTEGGLATALHELAQISRLGVEVQHEMILIHDETRLICDALGLDPLGLIASGALLATVPANQAPDALGVLNSAGIPASVIGKMVEDTRRRVLVEGERETPLPAFPVDEVARFFARRETN